MLGQIFGVYNLLCVNWRHAALRMGSVHEEVASLLLQIKEQFSSLLFCSGEVTTAQTAFPDILNRYALR